MKPSDAWPTEVDATACEECGSESCEGHPPQESSPSESPGARDTHAARPSAESRQVRRARERSKTKAGAAPSPTAKAEPKPLILDAADPLPSARAFVARSYVIDGVLALRHQGGVFYGHTPAVSAYHDLDEATVRAELTRFLKTPYDGVTQRNRIKKRHWDPSSQTKPKSRTSSTRSRGLQSAGVLGGAVLAPG